MSAFKIGVKVYDNDWFLKYGLSYQEAAQVLMDWGVSYVLAQSKYLPMPDSAVESEVSQEYSGRYAQLDDRKFRDALAEEGIEYWATVCTFFDPPAIEENPEWRPIGSDGRPMNQVDWYVGIAPSMMEYVNQKIAAIANAVDKLEPDGVFLSFTRWPGFWELWTPKYQRGDFPEYSYDPITLRQFNQDTGAEVPEGNPSAAAEWIDENVRELWTAWKCQKVVDVICMAGEAARNRKPNTKIMLNTLPFGDDFEGAQAEVFGQNVGMLAEMVDVFEVMTYHQILKRPIQWIPQVGNIVKQRTGKETVCTLQATPLYLEGIHTKEKRSPALDVQEFAKAVKLTKDAGLDGVVVFVWSDLLERVFKDRDLRWIEALQGK
ncbi:MAG: hypothetical protein ISR59_02440 [Anaerolineales bacterium]|uniref:Glycosyl hydrolase-like 10 domain-containing protein n=1 Tax=Candidatus Desulfolinea nitratireducens TaxID=2841698 RepID=A0A8J6NM82_9CHLR|nr:hypothetical protein [Candidatus Desulfolinea nitratireducens]MBL6959940.1 hypothetical protein [Anaerolineales bacterium]